ncbi:Crp/Fnr family transcriptional regulator [Niallia sp. XMNu-256]|uniref:Crp/Fnr family transcriptional regulator n=1 Tax=Niallia sp. XMNu-256 TaxID=3082444 RepID=UPI0030D4B891
MNQVNLLESSSSAKLSEEIEKIGTYKRYEKNEIIYLQDDQADSFYLLKSGRVRLFLTALNGNEKTMKILKHGELFGDASYFSRSTRITSASALTDVELLSVDLDNLMPHLKENPIMIAELLDSMAKTIRLFSIQVYSMGFLTADKKIAHLLLQLGSSTKQNRSDQQPYRIDCTHQELADLIGLARVTTTKELKKLEKYGWICLSYRSILIKDEAALTEFIAS